MISVVIPAYNEAERIASTIRALYAVEGVGEILVIDDGSEDDTAIQAERAGARVVRLPVNRGKGAALAEGVRMTRGDVVVMLDADLGECADQARLLLTPVEGGTADMAIATFPVIPGKGGGLGIVVRLARWGIRRCTRRVMEAPLSGQRAFRRAVWERIEGFAPGFEAEVAMTIDTVCAGFRVVEIPTTMTHRVTGRDWPAIRHRGRQLLAVARALWARRRLRC